MSEYHGKLFPSFGSESVMDRVRSFWNLSDRFPVPSGSLTCGNCKSEEFRLREYGPAKMGNKTIPYRCDVAAQCWDCFRYYGFGIPVPEEFYSGIPNPENQFSYREAEPLMDRELSKLFPQFSEEGVWERVAQYWNLNDYSLPVPREEIRCGNCQRNEVQVKNWSTSRDDNRTIPSRIDLTTKCTVCSKVDTYGIPIPDEMYHDVKTEFSGTVRWDEGLAWMVERNEILPSDLTDSMRERLSRKFNVG